MAGRNESLIGQFFLVGLPGSQFNGLFIPYVSTAKAFSLVRGISKQGKQTRNLVSYDPTNFETSKIYQGNV